MASTRFVVVAALLVAARVHAQDAPSSAAPDAGPPPADAPPADTAPPPAATVTNPVAAAPPIAPTPTPSPPPGATIEQIEAETLGGETSGRCPRNMAAIEGRFCIDRYEAGLVDVRANG